jgi:hypothetical protein
MKQIVNYKVDTPASVQHFITTWKRLKHYPQTDYLTVGECWELLVSTTRQLHRDEIASGVYDRALVDDEGEYILAWNGEQPLDLLFYKVVRAIKKRLSISILT